MKSNIFNYNVANKLLEDYCYQNKINKLLFKLMFFTGLFSMILFSACRKDKGNYTLTDVNDIAVKTLDTVVVHQGEILKITPDLLQRVTQDESKLSYEWSILIAGRTKADSTYQVLATTRNLEVNTTDLLPQSEYYPLYYKITDTQTGITYRKLIKLQVITYYQTGWVVLENNGTTADMGFINLDDDKAYHNLFSSANASTTLPNTANRVFNIIVPASNSLPKSTFTTVLYNNDGYVLDNGTFKIQGKYSTLFNSIPSIIKPQFMQMELSNELSTINNGKLYRRYASRGQLLFGNAFTMSDGSNYMLSPHVGLVSYGMVYFDELNHRFVKEGFNSSALTPMDQTSYPFDPTDVQKNLLAMKTSTYSVIYAVMKNTNDDECFIYRFSYGYPYQEPVLLANCPDISLSPGFLFPTNRDQMYYAAGNNLYIYNITTDTAEIIYSFPAGENVTALEMKDNSTIAVATYNG